jgi:phage terminase large subunit-like protein
MEAWNTALPDWPKRIVARQSMIPALPLNKTRADRALRIFKRLRLVDVPGTPTMGEACEPWVFEFVRAIFGAYDPETKRQLIKEFFLLIAKKNGKSSIAAGVMMTALIMNERRLGEYLILAPTKDIADNSFIPAAGMVDADRALRARYKPSNTTRVIENRLDGSVLEVKAADADVVGGQKAVAVFIDELWLFGKKLTAENMLSEATGSLASRPEGFVIFASTHSDEQPAGVFKKKLDYHRGVRDGTIIDPASLPLIYEYPFAMREAEAYRDPNTFYIPNPSLGRSVDFQWLVSQARQKEIEGPDSYRLFLAKHLNVEIGLRLAGDSWAGGQFWDDCAGPKGLTLEYLIERCEVIVFGIDGGGLDDLLGLAALGREKDTRRWLLWTHAWAHKIVLQRRKEIAPRLLDFEKDGDLTIVERPGDDVAAVADLVCQVRDAGLLPEKNAIGVDAVGIGDIVDELTAPERAITSEQIVGISQGWKLNAAIKTAGRKLAGGEMAHGGQPLMAWCVGNAKVELRGSAESITKQTAGSAKIDPLMGLFDAVSLMAMNPVATGGLMSDFLRNPVLAA